jgi:hypothetical protein
MLDRRSSSLEQIGYVHWHLSYWNIVKLFDVTQCSPFLIGDKIDGDTSATESTALADPETGSRDINISIVSFSCRLTDEYNLEDYWANHN